MPTYTEKVLADGQLPGSKGTLFTVPGANSAIVRWMSCVNVSGVLQVVMLYLRPGSTSRQLPRIELEADESVILFEDGPLELEAGMLIEGVSSDAGAVDYVISGILKS
jgi:hypothetical protein